MLPCVLPLSLRRTSLDTSELKTVKLLHLSGRPRSWTLYDFLNFAYLLLSHSKTLVHRTLYVGIIVCRRRLIRHLMSSFGSSITDVVMNYPSITLLEDLQPIGPARITVIFCLSAHLNNVIMFYEFSRYIKRTNDNY